MMASDSLPGVVTSFCPIDVGHARDREHLNCEGVKFLAEDGRALYEGETMRKLSTAVISAALAVTTAMPMVAQRDRRYDNNQYNNSQYSQGLRRGYGNGYNNQYDQRRYNNQDEYNRTHGGIGPGKGALIGGGGGAVLGALFGGGLKGAIIGGAAGAGVGAIAGKVHQDNKRDDWRDYRNDRR